MEVVDVTKKKGITSKAKKKSSAARAVIRKGKGRVTVNKVNVECIQSDYVRRFIREPLAIAGPIAETVDIEVNVKGGGVMGQADASRTAIAKALVEYTEDDDLKKKYLLYDRSLLVSDPRRKLPKKPMGRGARARRQKSYR